MSDEFLNVGMELLRVLVARIPEDAELRARLRRAVEGLTAMLDAADAAAAPAASEAAPSAPSAPPAYVVTQEELDRLGEQLRISGMREAEPAPPPPSVPAWQVQAVSRDELHWIETRCVLKAEATRWAVSRKDLMDRGADYEVVIQPKDREIIGKAKELPDCFLWMSHPSGPAPGDSTAEAWDLLAETYDNVARACVLMQELYPHREDDYEHFETALELAAESQSALRAAVRNVGLDVADTDQDRFFKWLRSVAQEESIYIARYMRVTDMADPARCADLQNRLSELDAAFQQERQQKKDRQRLLAKARFHAQHIERAPGGDLADDWRKTIAALEALVELGVPPSSTEIRNILLPVVETLPELEEDHPKLDLILREIDAYVSTSPIASSATEVRAPIAEVQTVGGLLHGRCVVMIGGTVRPQAAQAIENAFQLDKLLWLESTKHQSIELFRPYVERPEVALVLLAIRWSSHSFGEVKAFCDEFGKPLVRLPGGYNPNQIAVQILGQAGEQLRGAAENGG